ENLTRYRELPFPIGINVGKNRDAADVPAAHAAVVKKLYSQAAYFTINVSSPNTPGLRALQEKGMLTEIVRAVLEAEEQCGGRKPTFVKIAPELSLHEVDDVVQVALENNLAGLVATNTTNNPDIKGKYGARWRQQAGGLSGDDAQYRSL